MPVSKHQKDRLNIVVGISGGIAAYKAVNLVRTLVLSGHAVQVVATEAALRFVGRPTLEAISRNPVYTDLYEGVAEVRHVALGQAADLVVIAPATANTIAKLAAGIADDLLGNTVLASRAPLVIAPAMHTEMWLNPATQTNIATLQSRGVTVVGPASGQLTGEDTGPGRMAEPGDIAALALQLVGSEVAVASSEVPAAFASHNGHGLVAGDLAGLRVVVTAGGTREPLDPVRFLGNRSSGKQGVAIAEAARDRGAEVTLICCNIEVPQPYGCAIRLVSTALELQAAVAAEAVGADAVVMAAAVADYRPAVVSEQKIKKDNSGEGLNLELVRNPDILADLAKTRGTGTILVGFAAETEPDEASFIALGRAKLAAKGADLLVMNRVGWHQGFTADDNEVLILAAGDESIAKVIGSKLSVGHRILDAISQYLTQ